MDRWLRLEEGTTRDIAGQQVVASYGNDDMARMAYQEGAALANRSHWGLIRVAGSTRHAFLHNLTTNDINALQPGQGAETVFLTSTARCVDLAVALATEDDIWLLASPERHATLLDWLPRFIFFSDDVQPTDERANHAIFSLLGPTSGTLLSEAGAPELLGAPMHSHMLATVAGVGGVRVVVGGGLSEEGYTLIVPCEGATIVWDALRGAGAEPMGADAWETLRVEEGRPAADHELTEEFNPLEAGLWEAVSFRKGCYIGQEVVARLDTYQKLKQQLWGLRLSAPIEVGAPVLAGGKEAGRVTSVTQTPGGPFALAFLRARAADAGSAVTVGQASATVVEIPFITRGRTDL